MLDKATRHILPRTECARSAGLRGKLKGSLSGNFNLYWPTAGGTYYRADRAALFEFARLPPMMPINDEKAGIEDDWAEHHPRADLLAIVLDPRYCTWIGL